MQQTWFKILYLLKRRLIFILNKQDNSLSHLQSGIFFNHALATPLNSLALNLDLAISTTPSSTPLNYLERASLSVDRIKSLMKTSHLSSEEELQVFYLKKAIRETLMLLDDKQEPSVIKTHLLIKNTQTLVGNKFLFQEALLCALKNSLESYPTKQGNKTVLLIVKPSASELIISITDGGKGLSWLEQQLVFTEGYTDKPLGSGVGMSWIKTVVEKQLRGKVNISSKKGKGTTMKWVLPIDSQSL